MELGCIPRIMAPARKEVCDCGILEGASKEPDHAIRWDERLKEYYIAYGKNGQDGRLAVYYCPFCGGSTPKSRAPSLFTHVTKQEEWRIIELFGGIRIVADVIARFGPPDEEREIDTCIRRPSCEGKPERGEVFRGLVYKNLSGVADI